MCGKERTYGISVLGWECSAMPEGVQEASNQTRHHSITVVTYCQVKSEARPTFSKTKPEKVGHPERFIMLRLCHPRFIHSAFRGRDMPFAATQWQRPDAWPPRFLRARNVRYSCRPCCPPFECSR